MPLSPELRAAYENARYIVHDDREPILRIGEPCPELDELLEDDGADAAAFITPFNPGGIRRHEDENNRYFAEFREVADALSYEQYLGEGNDPEGEWPHEPSLLFVGMPLAEAEALGRRFGQLAIVYIRKGEPAQLVVL
jgi:hypothetical protein